MWVGTSGVYIRTPSTPRGAGPTKVRNTKTCFGFFRTGLRYSDIRQYSGSVLYLGETSLIITEAWGDYRVAGELRPVFYATGWCVFIFAKLDIWNVCHVFTFIESNKKADSNSSVTDLYLGGAISNFGWETEKDDWGIWRFSSGLGANSRSVALPEFKHQLISAISFAIN